MELSLARLVYDQVDPSSRVSRDAQAGAYLQKVSVNLPNNIGSLDNGSLTAIETAMKQEGFMVQVLA